MARVELAYVEDCPHVGTVRAELMRAFAAAKVTPRWREWRIDDPQAPRRLRSAASPTVLVDGRDVQETPRGAGVSCRLKAPSAELISAALLHRQQRRGGWRSVIALLPAIALALLPKVACPACWPAYAGVLGSLGLGFLLDTAYLLPLTAIFLLIALAALGWRARRRRGYGPLALGAVAAAAILVGKFAFESDPAMYVGVGMLVGASLWNSWPRREAAAAACPACEKG